MADTNRGNRPLSPFMLGPYYRPQLNSVTSLLTRISGNALLISAILVVWWFLAASSSQEYFDLANGVLTSWFGDLVMVLSLWGLWYHTLAGIRHLIWDNGIWLEMDKADMLGWAVVAGSVVLTILTVIVI